MPAEPASNPEAIDHQQCSGGWCRPLSLVWGTIMPTRHRRSLAARARSDERQHTRNTWQNPLPPQESTRPPGRSMASQSGSAARIRASAVSTSTPTTGRTASTTSPRDSVGRSAKGSWSLPGRYAPAAMNCLPQSCRRVRAGPACGGIHPGPASSGGTHLALFQGGWAADLTYHFWSIFVARG
jgi:hypothetical protein